MKAIHRKLLRDLRVMKSQAIAIGLVMACGVATFVMSLSMLDSLSMTLQTYYEANRFADVFVHLKRAPQSLSRRIAEIPGVASVQTRVVEQVTLDMPNMSEPASGQIMSLPRDEHTGLNVLYLRAGRYPVGDESREVLLSEGFADAHGLRSGDTIEAVLNGRLETLRVVGIALSPEFIYLIPPGSVLPENRRYTIVWMGRVEVEAAFDMEGAFNDVSVRLMPGASVPEIVDRLDALTRSYGGLGAYSREDQQSHKFLANELRELRNMTLIVPTIFLGVAAFLLNIVMSRVIASQREQIAALKALGYSNREVGLHFYSFVMLIAMLAVIAGTIGGAVMGRGMTALYTEFFNFPTFDYTLLPRVVALGLVVSVVAASMGTAQSLWAAMRLPPAEAMRPQAPATYRPMILERIGPHQLVSPAVRMILRHLERRPIMTLLSVLGIAMSASILVVGSYTEDAIDYLLDHQFNRVQQYDLDVVLHDRTDDQAISTIRHMPGVARVEPYRAVSTRIHHGHRSRRVGILGLIAADGLMNLLEMDGRPVDLPQHGIVLSRTLAERLDVVPGDIVTVDALEGRRTTFEAPVAGLIDEFSGLSAYMHVTELNRMMREQYTMNGAFVQADASRLDELYLELHEAPQVAAVNVKSATVQSFNDSIARNLSLMRTFLIGFAVVIAFGVIYNNARISLSERSRDLATLRVIGFTRREIALIQLGELAIVTGMAIPVGLVAGYGLSWLTSVSTDAELFTIPFVIYPSTFILAAVVVVIASVVSGLIVRARLDRLDLVSVLKARE